MHCWKTYIIAAELWVVTFPIDFIHRMQNFENMKKVYNEQDI